ncbi:DUF4136 domain-containing protein [Parahaliea aestuarii]|uniref:DUF4136 domain-containing protein n=1 Tax=Parahaliea aestuarii TaxID=1852021 RepID=A0A5C8ZZJ4_9GAMM|nr:DUF4136 domain-containing protein [Parahaliea aestuarii]TXS92641.1 DUF4136 domain-containing protein [Parahaliea aestuarii]
MLLNRIVFATLLALSITACSGVETRPDDTANFEAANYLYYKWRSEPLDNRRGSTDPIYQVDPVLRKAVDSELKAKGYVLDPARAQFSVDYVYAEGLRMGETSDSASNISTYPGQIPNRNMDQASIDNAIALGGVKETSNIGLQFNDVGRKEEVWRVVITKIIDRVNQTDIEAMKKTVNTAIRHGLRPLPNAD